jgi:hypothetical protein
MHHRMIAFVTQRLETVVIKGCRHSMLVGRVVSSLRRDAAVKFGRIWHDRSTLKQRNVRRFHVGSIS